MTPDYTLGNACNKEIECRGHTTYWVRCAMPHAHEGACSDIPRSGVSFGRETLRRAEIAQNYDANGAPL